MPRLEVILGEMTQPVAGAIRNPYGSFGAGWNPHGAIPPDGVCTVPATAQTALLQNLQRRRLRGALQVLTLPSRCRYPAME